MNRHIPAALAIALFCAIAPGRAPADLIVVNGTFDQPLTVGWTVSGDAETALDFGDDPFALFAEVSDAAFCGITQDVVLGPLATTLSFDYALTTAGDFSGGALRDAFSVRLLDPGTLAPLLATPTRGDVFYHEVPNVADPTNPDAGLVLFDSTLVTREPVLDNPNRDAWRRINVNISSLAGQSVRLEFGLLRADNGQSTLAGLDNVIPEPTTWFLFASLAFVLRGNRAR